MHWNSDANVDQLLGIWERVNREFPIAPLRWTIAHLNDASPETLQRMKALGIGWTVQDARYNSGDEVLKSEEADAVRRQPPVVTGQKIGVVIGAGTDAHRVSTYNPFTVLQWLLDGKNAGGTVLRGPEETPSRADALRFYTSGSAWVSHDEDVRGSLEVGKLADLAVLSKDYMTVPVDRDRRHRIGADDGRGQGRVRRRTVQGAREWAVTSNRKFCVSRRNVLAQWWPWI